MLTIPKAKLYAASELVKENANPFNVDKNKIKNLAPAAKAKLENFLVNFNTFVIYFDPSVDLSKCPSMHKGIRELQGTVAPFMRKGLTHYIITNNVILNSKGKHLASSNKNSDKLSAAKKLGLVIWNISKLEKIIAICLELKNEPKPLKEILRDERIFGPSTSRDKGKRSDCKVPFKGNFLLIEEISGKYKPVAIKEFEKEAWPSLQLGNSIGKCAFIKESKKKISEDEKSDQLEMLNTFEHFRKKIAEMLKDDSVIVPEIPGDDRFLHLNSAPLNEMHEFEEYAKDKLDLYERIKHDSTTVFQNSAASGLVSGSVAAQALKRDMTKDPRVAYLGTRVVSLVKDSKVKNEAMERSVPGKSFYNRPGFCENCGVKYNRFYEHVRNRQHKYWARQTANYKDLDILFAEMQRDTLNERISSEPSSFGNNIDIEALNADIYDSNEEYPFIRDIPPSIDTSKIGKKGYKSENIEENTDGINVAQKSSEDKCVLTLLNEKRVEKTEDDLIRTQGNQTEPIEAKFSHHSLHLEYQYGDTSCGSQFHAITFNESAQNKLDGKDWVPVKMTRRRTKEEHLILNPCEESPVQDTQTIGTKRSTNIRDLCISKKKRKTKKSTREIPYSLRERHRKYSKARSNK